MVSKRIAQSSFSCADDEDDEEEEEKAKTKTVKETVWDWDLLNENKALWLRSPSDVSEDEYLNFYKALAKVCPAQPFRALVMQCLLIATPSLTVKLPKYSSFRN